MNIIQESSRSRGLPTIYSGIQFRSRLEAVWASFFDVVGWVWEYEPDGYNGYIPDFVLHGAKHRIFVEVKPLEVYETDRTAILEKIRSAIGKADDLLILCDRFISADSDDCFVLGFMPATPDHPDWPGDCSGFGDDSDEQALLCTGSPDLGHGVKYDLRHTWGSWAFRLSGVYEGNAHFFDVEKADFMKLWSRARNRIQWKPDR